MSELLYDPLTEYVLGRCDGWDDAQPWKDAYKNCYKCGARLIRKEILGFKRETGNTYVKQVYLACSSLANSGVQNSSHDVWYVDIKPVKKKKKWWFI